MSLQKKRLFAWYNLQGRPVENAMTREAPSTIIYSKIVAHRGAVRIWIEGRRLTRAGIKAGDAFEVESRSQSITMRFKPEGTHTVSRRIRGDTELPIIDVRGRQLLEAFKADDRVRIIVRANEIEITLHHHSRHATEREKRLMGRIQQGKPLQVGSLAHGGGVLDLAMHQGFADAGVASVLAFANEIEEKYLEAALTNNPAWVNTSIAIQGPMQDVEWNLLPKVDVLVAGLPCTGASLSGRAKNKNHYAEEHEGAGSLFVALLAAVTALNPAIVVIENVTIYAATPSMMVIRSVLRNLEYDIQEAIVGGRDYGALEDRKRMCMVAVSRGLPRFNLADIPKMGAPQYKLGDVMDDVPLNDERWRHYDYLKVKAERDAAKGSNFKRQFVTAENESIGVIGRACWKARSTEPFISHPSGDGRSRLLTPAEHARVKTIPEALIEGLPSTTAHEILGQSVIYNAFRAVARWIGSALQPQHCLLLEW